MKTETKHNHRIEADTDKGKAIKLSPLGYILKLISKWIGFTGLYAAFSVCQFCGQPGCSVGVGSASIVGAFFVLILQDWKILYIFLKERIKPNNG